MKTYSIVDNTGSVYAHDIRDKERAELIIGYYDIPDELEPEIIECYN